jgi:hypothetical protein
MLVRDLHDRTGTGVLITDLTRTLIRQSMEPLNIRVAGIIVAITAAPLVGDTIEEIPVAGIMEETLVGDTMEEIPVAGIMEETLAEEALVGDTTKV